MHIVAKCASRGHQDKKRSQPKGRIEKRQAEQNGSDTTWGQAPRDMSCGLYLQHHGNRSQRGCSGNGRGTVAHRVGFPSRREVMNRSQGWGMGPLGRSADISRIGGCWHQAPEAKGGNGEGEAPQFRLMKSASGVNMHSVGRPGGNGGVRWAEGHRQTASCTA
eukprot:GGOE01011790.1.p4 GENE.GGOE01011790.1~~GGOE01011790.1.p4  ORF type:complete len:163 (+),score=1.41 GGOE01011790.1:142-630(+)